MIRRLALLVVVATIVVAPVASALAGRGPARGGPPDGGVGGQISVDGAGSVRVTGSFLAFGDVGGMTVTVTDRRGDARVILGGARVPFPRRARRGKGTRARTIAFQPGNNQRVSIDGRNVTATFRSDGNVTLSITGTGAVRLDGVGTFRVNSRPAESWPITPITLPLRSTPRRAR